MSHLTEADRLRIEEGLGHGLSIRQLAESLGKARTTIAREIQNHRVASNKTVYGRVPNRCVLRRNCDIHHLCQRRSCAKKCSACWICNTMCSRFQEEVCRRLETAPYVCNGCPDSSSCVLAKKYYVHGTAHAEYKKLLVKARQGVNLTVEEQKSLSDIIHAGIVKGQSLHHIMASDKDSFTVCEKSVYRYVNAGIIRTKRGDMPRSCMLKPRRHNRIVHKVDTKCRHHRSYEDFQTYRELHPDTPIVEMDSVLGGTGGKVLLTMHFDNCGFMLAFLRDGNNSQSVIDVFNHLEELLTPNVFKRMFPVILTDNGSEFSHPAALETSVFTGKQRTRIFYCHPHSSWEKGHVENNHLNLRKIFPKGQSLSSFSQDDVDTALSHLNSMARKSLNDVPAITLFETIYGKGIAARFNIRLIPPDQVCLLPDLISK